MEASESLSCENNNISLFSALPESSNMYSNKDSNLISNPIKGSVVKPFIGQGRAGLKRKRSGPINQIINLSPELSEKIPGKT